MASIDLPRPVAFVLSGGASLGAVQVGMLRALDDAGIRPDLVVGSSVGAINGAVIASEPSGAADRLTHIWEGLRRADIFPGGLLAVVYLPAPCPMAISPFDFSHSGDLMRLAHEASARFLADVGPVTGVGMFGDVHVHDASSG